MWLDCLYVPSHYPRPATPVLSPLTHPLTHIRSAPVFPRLRNLAPPATSVRFCKLLMCSPLLGVYDTTKTATDRLSASGAGFLSPFLGIISFPDFRLECMWLHNPGRSFFFFEEAVDGSMPNPDGGGEPLHFTLSCMPPWCMKMGGRIGCVCGDSSRFRPRCLVGTVIILLGLVCPVESIKVLIIHD